MILKKGMILVFKNREETITKASNDRLRGSIVTTQQTYSTDFIMRWLELKFVSVKQV